MRAGALIFCAIAAGSAAGRSPVSESTAARRYDEPGSRVLVAPVAELQRVGDTLSGTVRAAVGAPAIASGKFTESLNTTGWHLLEIQTNSSFSDEQQAFAAGYLEGTLTASQIWLTAGNLGANASFDVNLNAFFDANTAFIRASIAANVADPWWHHVALVFAQLDGMFYGYTAAAPASQALPFHAFFSMAVGCDLEDIVPAVHLQARRAAGSVGWQGGVALPEGPQRAARRKAAGFPAPPPAVVNELGIIEVDAGHCSSLVVVTPGNTELLTAQSTWASFENMLRIYKKYDFPFTVDGTRESGFVPGVVTTFSGSPGSLFSGDDWYQMSPSLLVTLETTIGNSNASLYEEFVKPTTVLEWVSGGSNAISCLMIQSPVR